MNDIVKLNDDKRPQTACEHSCHCVWDDDYAESNQYNCPLIIRTYAKVYFDASFSICEQRQSMKMVTNRLAGILTCTAFWHVQSHGCACVTAGWENIFGIFFGFVFSLIMALAATYFQDNFVPLSDQPVVIQLHSMGGI